MHANNLGAWKRRTLVLCWICYTVSYLCRTNLSAVLDKLILELQITKAMAGTIGSLYFWTYAVGQILNGYLAQRVNPKWMITVGLSASMLVNAAIGLCHSYVWIAALWALNGLCLSMIWAPTFKILTNWFDSEEYPKVSVYISLPTTVGYLLSWGLIRIVTNWLPWKVAFFIPALCVLAFLAFWIPMLKPSPSDAGFHIDRALGENRVRPRNRLGMHELLIGYGLLFVGFAAVVQGLIKESINLWGPTLLSDIGGTLSAELVSAFSILIPIASTLGIFMVGQIIKRFNNSVPKSLLLLFGVGAVASGAIFALRSSFFSSVALLSLLMACVCGVNVLITVFLPMGFVKHNISTQVSGTLNFMVYVGAGLGGSLSGCISDIWGWNSMYLLWAMLCLLSVGVVLIWRQPRRSPPI